MFYSRVSVARKPNGFYRNDIQSFFSYVKANVNDTEVIMSSRPRAIYMLTGKQGTVFPLQTNESKFYLSLDEFNVDFIISGIIDNEHYYEDELQTDSNKFSLMHDAGTLKIYKVNR